MTYRVGHHSTSDDSTAYRSKVEVQDWQQNDSPITRFRKYLQLKSIWSDSEEENFKAETRKEILKSFNSAEKRKKPSIDELFTDVYDALPLHLQQQQTELNRLLKQYPEHYDTTGFSK